MDLGTFGGDEIFGKGLDTFGSFKSSETAAGSDDPIAKESSITCEKRSLRSH